MSRSYLQCSIAAQHILLADPQVALCGNTLNAAEFIQPTLGFITFRTEVEDLGMLNLTFAMEFDIIPSMCDIIRYEYV